MDLQSYFDAFVVYLVIHELHITKLEFDEINMYHIKMHFVIVAL